MKISYFTDDTNRTKEEGGGSELYTPEEEKRLGQKLMQTHNKGIKAVKIESKRTGKKIQSYRQIHGNQAKKNLP